MTLRKDIWRLEMAMLCETCVRLARRLVAVIPDD